MTFNFDRSIDRIGTSSVKYDLRQQIFGNSEVLPMWVADMDFETPEFIREAIIARAGHPVYGYTFRGVEYYEAIIAWMKTHHRWNIQKDDIVFCPGVVPALNVAVVSCSKPGDHILVQPPVYFPFFGAVSDHDRVLVNNQLMVQDREYFIDFDLFEEQAKHARMFILCNPHNPVGRCWRKEELEKLAEICLRHHVLVFSDEIHADLVLPGHQHVVFANLSPEVAAITLTAHAPSKTFNLAGLSTSSVVISDETLRKQFSSYLNKMHLGMGNLFGNIASTAAYLHGEPWRLQLMDYLSANIRHTLSHLETHIPGIRAYRPEATYMIWLDFREFGLSDEEIKHKMIHDTGLGFNPGPDFGPGGSGFMRMNIACPRQTLDKALSLLSHHWA